MLWKNLEKKSSYKIKKQRGTSGSDMRMKVDFIEKMIIEQKSHESGLEISHGDLWSSILDRWSN